MTRTTDASSQNEQKLHNNEHSHMTQEAHAQHNYRNIKSYRNPKDNYNNNTACFMTGQSAIHWQEQLNHQKTYSHWKIPGHLANSML